ncbi:MAG TPA: hypothetical protein VFF65_02705 [Phycisphaerales bacterium]|nr:hypothetical protein [Phycisphaerales bacterium]
MKTKSRNRKTFNNRTTKTFKKTAGRKTTKSRATKRRTATKAFKKSAKKTTSFNTWGFNPKTGNFTFKKARKTGRKAAARKNNAKSFKANNRSRSGRKAA